MPLAMFGTGTTICVSLQLVGAAVVEPKLNVLDPCVAPKLLPVTVTTAPGAPDVGDRELMIGGVPTVNGGAEMAFSPPTIAFG